VKPVEASLMVVYKTTNLLNGKIYIGKTSQNRDTYLGSGKLIKEAIKKYGKESFVKEILCFCTTLEELNTQERHFIQYYGSLIPTGYNISDGGEGGVVWKGDHPNKGKGLEVIWGENYVEMQSKRSAKMSQIMTGANNPMYGKIGELSPIHGEAHPFYGKKRDVQTRQRITEGGARMRAKLTTEERIAMFGHRKGKEVKLEVRRKLMSYPTYTEAKELLKTLDIKDKESYLWYIELSQVKLHHKPFSHYRRRKEWVSWNDYLSIYSREACGS
jgi:group I intron endonuclease